VADTLSLALFHDKSVEKLVSVNNVSLLSIKDHRLNDVRCATQCDPTMRELKNIIMNGWSNQRTQTPQSIVSYYNYRDELTVQDYIFDDCASYCEKQRLKPCTCLQYLAVHLGK